MLRKYVVGTVAAIGVAFSAGSVWAATISQSFATTEKLEAGSVVVTAAENSVALAEPDKADSLVGVVIPASGATVNFSGTNTQVEVATSGTATAFITDIGGPIKAGDRLAASPIKGVAMKATDSGKSIGVAGVDFSPDETTRRVEVTSTTGQTKQVAVGKIPIEVQVTYFEPAGKIVPDEVQGLANSLAGKDVSLARLVMSGLILGTTIIVVSLMMYSAVRGAIAALGRNPLAHKKIYRGLAQVTLVSVGILATGVTAIYLLLRT